MGCYLTSKLKEYESSQLSIKNNNTVTSVYDKQRWLGFINEVSTENKDVLIKFYHPVGPKTLFKASQEDKVWVPFKMY